VPWGYFEEADPLTGGLGCVGCLAVLSVIPSWIAVGGCCFASAFVEAIPEMYAEDPTGAISAVGCLAFLAVLSIVLPTVALVFLLRQRKRRQQTGRADAQAGTVGVTRQPNAGVYQGAAAPIGLSQFAGYSPGQANAQSRYDPSHVSSWWWLAPVGLMWLGGLIAWLATRERNPDQALNMLLLGVAITVVHAVLLGSLLLLLMLGAS